MQLILHSYRRCPFCIRTRIVLHLLKLEYKIVEEPLRRWTEWMQKWSTEHTERARVPVVRCIALSADGAEVETVMPESTDINIFLDRTLGRETLTPKKGSQGEKEMFEWISWCDSVLKPQIDIYKYGVDRVFDPEKLHEHSEVLGEMLQKIEGRLVEHEYLVEERLTLADIAIIPFIRQIMRTREGEFSFEKFPKVKAWTCALIDTDWFQNEVMKKYPLAKAAE